MFSVLLRDVITQKMLEKQIKKLICFLITFSPAIVLVSTQRWQSDDTIRGNSFGLENYLFQSFENSQANDAVGNVKRERPAESNKVNLGQDEQRHDLENPIAPSRHAVNRPKASPALNSRHQNNRFAEVNEDSTIRIPKRIEEPSRELSRLESVTDIIRTRVVAKRRKRPFNAVQTEGSKFAPDNKIYAPGKIPFFQGSRTTVRTTTSPNRQSDYAKSNYHSRPSSLMPILTTIRPIIFQEVQKTDIEQLAEKGINLNARTNPATERTSTYSLKAFLKQQTETLSLSELLQTQNLSLADLLKGNKDASAILKATPPISSTPRLNSEFLRKPSQGEKSPAKGPDLSIYRSQEILEKADSNEASTFKPHLKRTKSKTGEVQFRDRTSARPEVKFESDKETPKDSKKTNITNYHPQSRIKELREKLRNYQRRKQILTKETKRNSSEEVPQKERTQESSSTSSVGLATESPIHKKKKISYHSANNPKLTLVLTEKNRTDRFPNPKRKIEPEKMKEIENSATSSLEAPASKAKEPIENSVKNSSEMEMATSTAKSHQEQLNKISEKESSGQEAKDDLIELLRSKQNAEKLNKILQSRNMTLQEVLDNREKSTVQSSIEELFSKRPTNGNHITQPPILPEFEAVDSGHVEPSKGNEFEESHREDTSTALVSVQNREPKSYDPQDSSREREEGAIPKPEDPMADNSNAENLALRKLSEKSTFYENLFTSEVPSTLPLTEIPEIYKNEEWPEEETIHLMDAIQGNQIAKLDSINFTSDREVAEEDMERSYIPPAVKSAIIASGVVMGIALLIFMAIFAACGIRQRRILFRRSSSSILEDSLEAEARRGRSKRYNSIIGQSEKPYAKTKDFWDGGSESGTSFAGSYIWTTLRKTFTGRSKIWLEEEEKKRGEKTIPGRSEIRKNSKIYWPEEGSCIFQPEEDRMDTKKIDRNRNSINAISGFQRPPNVNYYTECGHVY